MEHLRSAPIIISDLGDLPRGALSVQFGTEHVNLTGDPERFADMSEAPEVPSAFKVTSTQSDVREGVAPTIECGVYVLPGHDAGFVG